MSPEVTAYFKRLQSRLQLAPDLSAEIVRELQDHLEDRAQELVRTGVPERQAWRIGLSRFGSADAIAQSLREAHQAPTWLEALFGGSAFAVPGVLLGLHAWPNPWIMLGVALAVLVIVAIGQVRDCPPWLYPWAGIGLIPPFIVGDLAVHFLANHAAAVTAVRDPRLVALTVGAGLYFPLAALLLAAAILVASRRDWLDASIMLAALPPMLGWLIAYHSPGGLQDSQRHLSQTSALIGSVYLGMSASTIAFLRIPQRPMRLLALLAAAVLLTVASGIFAVAGFASFILLVIRAGLLLVFLLSPALALRCCLRAAT